MARPCSRARKGLCGSQAKIVTANRFANFSRPLFDRFCAAHVSTCSLAPASHTGAMDMEKLAYSINETACTLSLGRTSVYAMIAEGRLEAFKLGRRTLIRADSIKRLVDGQG